MPTTHRITLPVSFVFASDKYLPPWRRPLKNVARLSLNCLHFTKPTSVIVIGQRESTQNLSSQHYDSPTSQPSQSLEGDVSCKGNTFQSSSGSSNTIVHMLSVKHRAIWRTAYQPHHQLTRPFIHFPTKHTHMELKIAKKVCFYPLHGDRGTANNSATNEHAMTQTLTLCHVSRCQLL